MDPSSSSPVSARVLMCPPDHFDVVSVDNPYMADGDELQRIDLEKAERQWNDLVTVLSGLDVEVHQLEPSVGLPDQVFTANPIFCVPGGPFIRSHMRHEGRQDEVAALSGAARRLGLKETPLMGTGLLEGGGDLLWHAGRVWMGFGFRSDPSMLGAVRQALGCRVTPLRLVRPENYHLDTALCILDERAALWVPQAFDEEARAELRAAFDLLLDVSSENHLMAANAWSIDGDHVVIDGACVETIVKLAEAGFTPVPVDTSEFRKAGGSVYCMKQVF